MRRLNFPPIGQALRLGVAAGGLALVKTSRLFGGAPLALSEQPLDLFAPDALARGLPMLFADLPVKGWPVSVVLADELVRLWQVPPPPGATRMGDLEAAAALRFQHLFGASGADWKISADWDAVDPFLAAAAPVALLDALAAAAREHGFHLVEVSPQFVAAMNAWRRERRPGAWFGLVHGGVLSLAAYEGRKLAAVRSAPIPAGADRDWLESHIAREALRVGIARPERLQLSGAAPAAWASSPGRLKFACSLLEQLDDWSELARLARTGVPA
ncbi:hypothetical protein [Massilia timonae]|uniref:hypothetical protein n=1 Tax=Massilia timonae TaxID=47229 RepID=UPI0008F5A58B|nr:hypothetical protein [Massilia timonae]